MAGVDESGDDELWAPLYTYRNSLNQGEGGDMTAPTRPPPSRRGARGTKRKAANQHTAAAHDRKLTLSTTLPYLYYGGMNKLAKHGC